MKTTSILSWSLLLPLLLGGCALGWQPQWQEAGTGPVTQRVASLLRAADECTATAGDGAAVDRCLRIYEEALLEHPANYAARVQAASLYILKGTAYSGSADEKSDAFRRAMKYAELAMYTNPQFRERVDAGNRPWEAVDTLGAAEAEAMYFWVTALQYEFKEGMSLPSKVINVRWLRRALLFLERIEAVAPEFGGGGVEVAQAICYLALPKVLGGSRAKGDEYLAKALVKGGDDWLLPRWARGKYYLPVMGDEQGAAAQLALVAAQEPGRLRDPYPWRVHFQDDARRILAGDR